MKQFGKRVPSFSFYFGVSHARLSTTDIALLIVRSRRNFKLGCYLLEPDSSNTNLITNFHIRCTHAATCRTHCSNSPHQVARVPTHCLAGPF